MCCFAWLKLTIDRFNWLSFGFFFITNFSASLELITLLTDDEDDMRQGSKLASGRISIIVFSCNFSKCKQKQTGHGIILCKNTPCAKVECNLRLATVKFHFCLFRKYCNRQCIYTFIKRYITDFCFS